MSIDRLRELREALAAEPFRPFSISLTDGRRLFVLHKEFVGVPPQASRTFYVAGTNATESIVDLLLVTSIDFETGTNGRGKRSVKGQ